MNGLRHETLGKSRSIVGSKLRTYEKSLKKIIQNCSRVSNSLISGKLNKEIIRENNGIFYWEFLYIFRIPPKFEMELRAAGWSQIRTIDSEVSGRIASGAGQSIKTRSPRLGLAEHWPYHFDGYSLRFRIECATSFLCSINLTETGNGECSDKNRSFFGIRNNFRVNSDLCPPGTKKGPRGSKETK